MTTPTDKHMWRSDPLPDGHRRDWTRIGHRYTRLATWRNRITAAIDGMDWYVPSNNVLPFSPGLALQHLIDQLKPVHLGGLGVSDQPLQYPEDQFFDDPRFRDWSALHPDLIATYRLLGLRQLIRSGWFESFFLDTGTHVLCIATQTTPQERLPGITMACALGRHRERPGTSRPEPARGRPDRERCTCDCGCTTDTRAPRANLTVVTTIEHVRRGDVIDTTGNAFRRSTVTRGPEPDPEWDGMIRIGIRDHISGATTNLPIPAGISVTINNAGRRGRILAPLPSAGTDRFVPANCLAAHLSWL